MAEATTRTSDEVAASPDPTPPGSRPTGESDGSTRRNYAVGYAGFIGALLLVGLVLFLFKDQADSIAVVSEPETTTTPQTSTTVATTTTEVVTTTIVTATTKTTTTTSTTTTVPPSTIPLAARTLQQSESVFGDISPKSVVATPNGLFFAQNMMYRHTVTVYDQDGSLLATIPDSVDLSEFGVPGGEEVRGAPVEAASTSDGRYVYVSNYAMYGPGFGREPGDDCADSDWDNSYLYRIDTASLEIDQVIEVGAVPKFLAVSPDDRFVLVTNWCSYDLSIVDVATAREILRVDIGRHPRGIAITSDSSTAYVSEMGGSDIAVVPLSQLDRPDPLLRKLNDPNQRTWPTSLDVDWIENVGRGPRHLLLSPDDSTLYATLNGEGRVVKIDVGTGEVIGDVRTGQAPRSMAISVDGEALYVVNYNSDTMSKVLTETMEEIQEVRTADKPIGIAVDPQNANVWVSNYSGVLEIFEDVDESDES